MATECNVCFRHCRIEEGKTGFCGARGCVDGRIVAKNYGRATSLALDPIEKKPLNRFMPKSIILSVGSYGCNLRCPYCQNYEISWGKEVKEVAAHAEYLSPEMLAQMAYKYRDQGNIGVAFTYNEPLIGYEYVRDAAKLVAEQGMKNVLVTNGTASKEVFDEIASYIHAMNIDLKGFSHGIYEDLLGGNREMVLSFIEEAVKVCHVELTTLVVPGVNDSEEEMRKISTWISELKDKEGNVIGREVPLHISRFFPRFHMTDREATPVERIYHLKDIAAEKLRHVYTGNC